MLLMKFHEFSCLRPLPFAVLCRESPNIDQSTWWITELHLYLFCSQAHEVGIRWILTELRLEDFGKTSALSRSVLHLFLDFGIPLIRSELRLEDIGKISTLWVTFPPLLQFLQASPQGWDPSYSERTEARGQRQNFYPVRIALKTFDIVAGRRTIFHIVYLLISLARYLFHTSRTLLSTLRYWGSLLCWRHSKTWLFRGPWEN